MSKKKETQTHRVCRSCGVEKEKKHFRAYYGKGERSKILYRKWDCLVCENKSNKETDKRLTEKISTQVYHMNNKLDQIIQEIAEIKSKL